MGEILSGSRISSAASSSFDGGVATTFFLWVPNHFLIDEPGGFGLNNIREITSDCDAFCTTMNSDDINPSMYSIMVVGDGVSRADSATVIVLEFEITILCGKNRFVSCSCREQWNTLSRM